MPQIVEVTTYTFPELSDSAKETARDWYRSLWDETDSEEITEAFSEILSALGLGDLKVYWSLGYMQSDHVSLVGSFSSSDLDTVLGMVDRGVFNDATWLDAFKPTVSWGDFPTLSEYRDDLDFIVTLREGSSFYRPSFEMEANELWALDGFEYDDDPEFYDTLESKLTSEHMKLEDELKEYFSSVCHELQKVGYGILEYRHSDEHVDDMLTVNEYQFTEDGKLF